ncbi:MAG: hypothetical protein IJV41_07625 [Oscillospiraceae bacterium]|nr:hypothetical protein [Oscillospiraceae bacterium]
MKKALRSPIFTGVLFLLALALLLTGSIGTTRAALNIQSDTFYSDMALTNIGVALTENRKVIVSRDYSTTAANGVWSNQATGTVYQDYFADLIPNMVKDAGDKSLVVGKKYPIDLGVQNTGTIDEYVRVTIYRYWVDTSETPDDYGWFHGTGTKKLNLDPKLIDIGLTLGEGWTLDDAPSESGERIVLYYTKGLLPSGGTAQFADSLTIKNDVFKFLSPKVVQTQNGNQTVITYSYDDIGFVVDVQVDAVQNKHADAARTSAWGEYR